MPLAIYPASANLTTRVPLPFFGSGGTAPYTFSVTGAGGTISPTGVYTAPSSLTDNGLAQDIVKVTDSLGAEANATVYVGNCIQLLMDILRVELNLAQDCVYLYNQKIFLPEGQNMAIAVGVVAPKVFGNNKKLNSAGDMVQTINMSLMLDLNIISRDLSALNRKEEVVMALNSVYSDQQQALNSFRIFPITTPFVNLSQEDGSAIPYRFNISVNMQYAVTKTKAVPYFTEFAEPTVTTDPDGP